MAAAETAGSGQATMATVTATRASREHERVRGGRDSEDAGGLVRPNRSVRIGLTIGSDQWVGGHFSNFTNS